MNTEEILPPLGRLPLAREDVDRGCEVRTQEGWLETVWERPETRVVWLLRGRAPVVDGHIVLVRPEGDLPADAVYLGRSDSHLGEEAVDGTPHAELVLVPVQERPDLTANGLAPEIAGRPVPDPAQVAWVGLRDVAAGLNDRDAGIFVEAVAISNWHATNQFCSRCGAPTEAVASGWVRTCTRDGAEHFPRTDPAIIVTVTDQDGRVLLGNNAAWAPDLYSTLAGFVEPGEAAETAVVREIFEESGLVVHSPRYLGSQPWPFPQSLMLGFTAVTDQPEAAQADEDEMRSVRWFTRDELGAQVLAGEVTLPGGASISRALIEHWYGGPLPEPRTLEN